MPLGCWGKVPSEDFICVPTKLKAASCTRRNRPVELICGFASELIQKSEPSPS